MLALLSGNTCLTEGTAKWYGYRAWNPFYSEEFADWRGDPENGDTPERMWWSDFPSPDELSHWSKFEAAFERHGPKVYEYCAIVFDVLQELAGDPGPYWRFVSQAGEKGWEKAFADNFGESWSDFVERFENGRKSLFTDLSNTADRIAEEERQAARERAEATLDRLVRHCDTNQAVCAI